MLIFLIIFVVFGADKLPKIAKDLGKGIKEFKKAYPGKTMKMLQMEKMNRLYVSNAALN